MDNFFVLTDDLPVTLRTHIAGDATHSDLDQVIHSGTLPVTEEEDPSRATPVFVPDNKTVRNECDQALDE